jgi:flagellar biosynthesis/type III secretory pathway chaperone
MASTPQNDSSTPPESLLGRMRAKMSEFQALLREEQQAIRCLSFGQFSSVTLRKERLLEEIRILEGQRRSAMGTVREASDWLEREESALATAIAETDRMNRFNAALIGQSLQFLEGTLRLWQRSPESDALYSSSGAMVPSGGARIRTQG